MRLAEASAKADEQLLQSLHPNVQCAPSLIRRRSYGAMAG